MSLVVENLRVSLSGIEILRGVTLAVANGNWVTIVGPNGAGKSTLMRAVLAQVKSSGSIIINGTAATSLSPRDRAREVAFVAQDPVVPPAMTVIDYVLLGRTPHLGPLAVDSPRDQEIVRSVLDRLDLQPFAGRSLDQLSGGERQRVFIARALAQQAPLLLLDEPTTSLDIGHQQDVLNLIDTLRVEDGLTVLSTMHDLTVAAQYSNELIMLADGKIVATGTPAEVLTEDLIEQHYEASVLVLDTPNGPVVVPARKENS
jgi:iron complex transport system ATP-binding protein